MIEVHGGKQGYVASLVAERPISPMLLLHILTREPIQLEGFHGLNFWAAESDEEAHDIVMSDLKKRCPPEDGWTGHSVRVLRVDNIHSIPRDRPILAAQKEGERL